MTMNTRTMVMVLAGLMTAIPGGMAARPADAGQRQDECSRQDWGREREGVCEVRELTLPSSGALTVDASPNGGIKVEGTQRYDVYVRARVVATAATEERARQILSEVRVQPSGDRLQADGPRGLGRREGWHVSYDLLVPSQMSLSLSTVNGGLTVRDVEGRLELSTTNGGVKLASVGGDVRGRTTNGGIDVELDGATWRGEGLDLETTNGGVRLTIPEGYSAKLEAGTVNGGFNSDIPLRMRGRWPREVEATLGAGGPTIRVKTSNGGVRITKR